MTDTPDAAWSRLRVESIRTLLEEEGFPADVPVVKALLQTVAGLTDRRATLLAVCPNSEAVTRAALRAAKEADAPLLLAATLNQVDREGGYTGWTPDQLVRFVAREAERIGVPGLVLPCLDHGGPWLKDEHTRANYSYEETLEAVKRSVEACIDAGYALLHLDPTVDRRRPDSTPPIEWVVERTVELIAHAEAYRNRTNRPPISYEVGTEEVQGGLADLDTFASFLERLDAALHAHNLEDAWPCFVVGKVGTDLDTTSFDPEVARRLTEVARPYGVRLKGHYTDYVANPEDYPLSGMGGANVGPEFTEVEYEALMELVRLEHKLGRSSELGAAVRDAVVDSRRWTKWLRPEEAGAAFDELSAERQQWLIRTGSRYIWTEPNVQAARRQLRDNLRGYRDAEAYVVWRIQSAILKYYHAFNLIGLNQDLP
jgi:tagatose-1,6-bisphosphate aldolase non-catalytic subunit AgaZ/GatZ